MKLDTICLAYPWAEEQKGPLKFATAAVAPDVTAVLLFRTVNLQANCPRLVQRCRAPHVAIHFRISFVKTRSKTRVKSWTRLKIINDTRNFIILTTPKLWAYVRSWLRQKKNCWEWNRISQCWIDFLQFLNNILCIYFDPKYMFAVKLVDMVLVRSELNIQ